DRDFVGGGSARRSLHPRGNRSNQGTGDRTASRLEPGRVPSPAVAKIAASAGGYDPWAVGARVTPNGSSADASRGPAAGRRESPRDQPSAVRLLLRRGQGAEHGEHRVQVGQAGAEAVDELGEGEVAVDEVLVVLGDVIGQVAEEGGVDLFETA